VSFAPLDGAGLARLWARLVGAGASALSPAPWSTAPNDDDETRLTALIALASARDPAGWTASDFVGLATHGRGSATEAATETDGVATDDAAIDPVALGVALATGRPSNATLAAAERHVATHPAAEALRLALLRALGLRGETARALLVDRGRDEVASPKTSLALAELARKAGDRALARTLAGDGRASLLARLAFDEGDLGRARVLAMGAPNDDPRGAEVRALVLVSEGKAAEARVAAELGLALAQDEETLARLHGVLGYVAHASGDATTSLGAYREAARAAGRAGAVLEEATYLTGVAAAGTDAGAFVEARHAARRATLLWDALGRRRDAARALLAEAAACRVLGVRSECRALAEESFRLACEGGDDRGAAYAQLVLADAALDERSIDEEALAHADRHALAAAPRTTSIADRLRVLARRVCAEARLSPDEITEADRVASSPDTSMIARLEWWTARANDPTASGLVSRSLASLLDEPAPLDGRGRAAEALLRLARGSGDGALARRATAVLRRLAATATAHLGDHGNEAELAAMGWLASAAQEGEGLGSGLEREDAGEVLRLFRVLSTRDSLRDVLRQVLDALVLWTGVERGLLLLPRGDSLVPRAARNLSREDLHGEQLRLSLSLARRAFTSREPVSAVDASSEADELASVHALQLRSVLAVPLLARGDVVGVVYLDDRVRRGAFGEREIAWVSLAAGAAALAIADTRDRVLLRRAVRRAERAKRLAEATLMEKEVALIALERTASPRAGVRHRYPAIVGDAAPLDEALRVVDRVAPTDLPVLLAGESGTGKELFARALHDGSSRAKKRFVSESCAAIPETLLEATLFGHERGAFTGAVAARAGLFVVADGGTLFLDEVGELPLLLQSKLLRVLQDGELRPLGATTARKVDVRIIAATHRDLRAGVRDGTFREDLFYRLCVVEVKVPALRERREDIPLLVTHFLRKYDPSGEARATREALECLARYPFPGNVRQLENEVRRALALGNGVIDLGSLSEDIRSPRPEGRARALSLHVRERVDDLERELIREALVRSGGNKTKAAELLGVSRFGLSKMEKRLALLLE
jgi:transcriptional regulator with GAF, ATPase, and Fis domain